MPASRATNGRLLSDLFGSSTTMTTRARNARTEMTRSHLNNGSRWSQGALNAHVPSRLGQGWLATHASHFASFAAMAASMSALV